MIDSVDALQPGQTFLGLTVHVLGESYRTSLASQHRIRVGVIDTDILLSDVRHSLQTGYYTSLIEAARMGTLRVFASTTVRDEVWEKLGNEELMKKLGMDSSLALRRWQQVYLPRITFLDPTGLPLLSKRVRKLQDKDRDDVPTGQIIELLQPDVAFCFNTRHLGAFEVTARGWVWVAVAYRDLSRQQGLIVSIHCGSGLALQGMMATASGAYSLALKVDQKVWLGLLLALLGICSFVLVHPPSRRWLLEHKEDLARAAQSGIRRLGEGLAPVMSHMAAIEQKGREAEERLAQGRHRTITRPRSIVQVSAMVLARSLRPLRVDEIIQQMEHDGYRATMEDPERSFREVLGAQSRLFVEEEGRWSLKSYLA